MLEMKTLIQLDLDKNEVAGMTLCMNDILVADSDGKSLPLFFESPDEHGLDDNPRCCKREREEKHRVNPSRMNKIILLLFFSLLFLIFSYASGHSFNFCSRKLL